MNFDEKRDRFIEVKMRRNLCTFQTFIFRDLLKLKKKKKRNPLLPVDIRFDVFEEK